MKPNAFITRFLSDFTLGFSDGLTVPFALTAGLSLLGNADTIVYAGLAELCAGSISMGIGGYLASRDENPAAPRSGNDNVNDEEEGKRMLGDSWSTGSNGHTEDDEKPRFSSDADIETIQRHLEPLNLPETTISNIFIALSQQPKGVERAATRLRLSNDDPLEIMQQPCQTSPIISGLAISLGYLIGGTIPLLPYLFVTTVGTGLLWSTCLCLLALFTFGFGKTWVLQGEVRGWRCLRDGIHMLILGSVAAGAAVVCVKLLERGFSDKDR